MIKVFRSTVFIFAVAFFASAVNAQSPYPSLEFAREPNNAGTTDYVLKPIVEEIHKKVGGSDKPYRILGAVARPSTQRAVLMFANAQQEFQLYVQKDLSVVIKADSQEFGNMKYELASKREDQRPIKLEIANVLITYPEFRTIANARSVVVKFGGVVYQLDKDNIDALRYMAAEIEKDLQKNSAR